MFWWLTICYFSNILRIFMVLKMERKYFGYFLKKCVILTLYYHWIKKHASSACGVSSEFWAAATHWKTCLKNVSLSISYPWHLKLVFAEELRMGLLFTKIVCGLFFNLLFHRHSLLLTVDKWKNALFSCDGYVVTVICHFKVHKLYALQFINCFFVAVLFCLPAGQCYAKCRVGRAYFKALSWNFGIDMCNAIETLNP
jgi:hypothetical protein